MESWKRELYLQHVGVSKLNGAKIGSGRYPLGSGERPRAMFKIFGTKDGKHKPTTQIVKKVDSVSQEDLDKRKRQAIDEGDVKFIQNNVKHFTNKEITEANQNYVTRKNLANNVREVKEAEKKKKKDVFEFLEKFNKRSATLLTTLTVADKFLALFEAWANGEFQANKKKDGGNGKKKDNSEKQ